MISSCSSQNNFSFVLQCFRLTVMRFGEKKKIKVKQDLFTSGNIDLVFFARCLLPLFSSVHQYGEWAFQPGQVRDDCASVQPSRPMASTVAATNCEGLWRLHWTCHPQLLDPRHLLYKKGIFLMILCNILTYLVYNWWKQSIYFWITPKLYNSRIYKKK